MDIAHVHVYARAHTLEELDVGVEEVTLGYVDALLAQLENKLEDAPTHMQVHMHVQMQTHMQTHM